MSKSDKVWPNCLALGMQVFGEREREEERRGHAEGCCDQGKCLLALRNEIIQVGLSRLVFMC